MFTSVIYNYNGEKLQLIRVHNFEGESRVKMGRGGGGVEQGTASKTRKYRRISNKI